MTLGVEPTYAATAYGYVVSTGDPTIVDGHPTYRVERFEEKPTEARAAELLASGTASWNAGAFVWRRDALIGSLARHAPDISGPISPLRSQVSRTSAPSTRRFARPRSTTPCSSRRRSRASSRSSRCRSAGTTSGRGRAKTLRQATADGNVLDAPEGSVIDVGSERVLVHAEGGRLVALVGVSDLVVVDTPDALLICTPTRHRT